MAQLAIFTIYYDPKDFPKKWVARRFNGPNPTKEHFVCDDVENVRRWIKIRCSELGMGEPVCFKRDPNDDPKIIESWI